MVGPSVCLSGPLVIPYELGFFLIKEVLLWGSSCDYTNINIHIKFSDAYGLNRDQ